MTEQIAPLNKLDQPMPIWVILLGSIYAFVAISVLVFPVAGNWGWTEGWVFVITTTFNITVSQFIINNKNPRVLRNRSRLRKEGIQAETRQAASSDWFVLPLLGIGFLGAMIMPGLGYRFGWYALPFGVAMAGVLLIDAGLVLMNIAALQNSFASKILDINQDQVLVDTGLYAHIRHPMYSGGILMLLFTPVALGCLWGLLPALLAVLLIILRIRFEEEMLVKGMAGYVDYQTRVRHKLIPGVY